MGIFEIKIFYLFKIIRREMDKIMVHGYEWE